MQVTPVAALRDNYIWLIHGRDDPARVFAVDPGDDAPVQHALRTQGLKLAGILVTHHHWDHTDGIEALVAAHGCEVWGPATEQIPCRTHALAEGDTVTVLGWPLAVLDIPGHTAGHIAFHGQGALFCGDTLFGAGCGRLFEGTPGQMSASLAKLAVLPGDTRVHCGHEYTAANLRFALVVEPGNELTGRRQEQVAACRARGEPSLPSRLSEELATNPFLRSGEPAVRAAAERRAGRSPLTPVEVFATVRAWKDAC